MSQLLPLGNVIITCSGNKTEHGSEVNGFSVASFASSESTIAILRKTADLLEENALTFNITYL